MRVVAHRRVSAHEQAVRFHLFGVAREDFLEQLGERRLLAARKRGVGDPAEQARRVGDVALPQVQPYHVEVEREARRVARDQLLRGEFGAPCVLSLDVGAHEHGAHLQVVGPLARHILQDVRRLVRRAERRVRGEQARQRRVRRGLQRQCLREGVERRLDIAAGREPLARQRVGFGGHVRHVLARVALGEAQAHVRVRGVEVGDAPQDSERLAGVARAREGVRRDHVLRARLDHQPLLLVELGEGERRLVVFRAEARELLVHRDGLEREALFAIMFGDAAVAGDGLRLLVEARVEVADGVERGEVARVRLGDALILL